MSNKSKEVSANLNRMGLFLFLLTMLITLFCFYKTLVGGFNPFLWGIAWFVESITQVRYLPSSFSDATWNNLGATSFVPVLVALSVAIGLTFLTAIGIGNAVYLLLKRVYIKKELGDDFLARYKKFEKNRKNLNINTGQSDVESARYKYYLEWRSFYKSSLTYPEWEEKILKSKYK
ncbi:hypothetical protein LXA54_17055 [Erwinia amylovora]|uniref:hypothetical protein n=1 Tax=Erwinia amylovora TaxID=552 RepID=UPI0020BD65BE|nr:hypothetical protein [Erwinia amylovora]MCK8335999.1 hypothetical protein [Erwinia amylovora]